MHEEEKIKFSWLDLVKSVWFLLDKNKGKFAFWTAVLTIINFYVIVPPLILGKIVDFFVGYQKGGSITTFFLLAIGLGASSAVVAFIRLSTKQLLGNIRSDVVYSTKVKGFENLLNFSLRWHDEENTGAKVQRIENGIFAYRNLSQIMNNQLIGAVTTFVGIISVFAFLNAKYIIFFILYVIVFAFIIRFFYSRIYKANEEYNKSLEKAGGSFVEGLSNILTIKTLGAGEYFKTHIANKEELARKHEYLIRYLGISMWRTFQVFNGICFGLFLSLVGLGVINGEVSTGSIIIFFGYFVSLRDSASEILEVYEQLIGAKTAIGRMMPIVRSEEDDSRGKLNFPGSWKKIQFMNANFSYRQEETDKILNLHNINIKIDKNQKIGVVGKTGSGKSTLSKILVGLYRLNSGEYKIGNTNFHDISKNQISKKMSLVLQDSEMFNLSLKDNITLLRRVNRDLLLKAIKVSQLEEVIQKLPDGLDTLIGEKGYHLSGGERQRVGIARAICRNPEIFIFDEATSSLDSKTEALVHGAIEKELKDKTLIIIAHRITTLKNVDTIYVMKEGRVVEQGSYDELFANRNSEFNRIHNLGAKKKSV